VILAHHADDQAETVLQRLLRGAGYSSLGGIAPRARVAGVQVIRPMLGVRRATLREFLSKSNLLWREDSSNTSPTYLRNRLRVELSHRDDLTGALLDLSHACWKLKRWTQRTAPRLDDQFPIRQLDELPTTLARRSASGWLRRHDLPAELIDRAVVDRLRLMCADAASAARQQFPGGIFVRRRGGIISAE
jgi:tRNA(Ile)-lysidine synthase TilS/MesJ